MHAASVIQPWPHSSHTPHRQRHTFPSQKLCKTERCIQGPAVCRIGTYTGSAAPAIHRAALSSLHRIQQYEASSLVIADWSRGATQPVQVSGELTMKAVTGSGPQQDAQSGSGELVGVSRGSEEEQSEDCMPSWSCSWSRTHSSLLLLMGFSTKRSIPQSSQGLSVPQQASS